MRVEWHTVGDICSRVYKDLEAAQPSRFNGLVNIGIDETSYKKGHKYIRTAYGFRNADSLIAMVMLSCSDIQTRLPER